MKPLLILAQLSINLKLHNKLLHFSVINTTESEEMPDVH